MPKLIVSVLTSLDGYHAQEGGDLSQLPFDDGFSRHNLALIEAAGTLLMGRTGYEEGAAYWPDVQHDETQPEIEREISRRNTAMEKIVVSDSLELDPQSAWTPTTRVVRRADAVEEVGRMRREGTGDLLMFSNPTTWTPLLEAGLVDELIVLVGPALLGDGSKLYSGARAGLALQSVQVLPDSQLVELRYTPA